MGHKFNATLLVLVVALSCSVVSAQYTYRQQYSALQKEKANQHQLEVEYGQLRLERSTWGAHALVERTATQRLHMHAPDPKQIQMIIER